MIILGIGGLLGDAACAILKDGELAAAVEESKLVRRSTHTGGVGHLPDHAIATCLNLAGAKPEEVDAVAVVRPIPDIDFHLKLRTQFPASRIVVLEHHLAHAASAFYASPFEEATVLTLDRGSDFRCGSRWQAQGSAITLEFEHYSPDSLGDVYGRVTELLNLESNADEHKVQWLSVAGDGRYTGLFADILSISPSGPRIDRSFFSTERVTLGGFGPRFYERLGLADGARIPDDLRPHVAAGIQKAVERAVIEMAGKGANLCFAGGLGLNALLISALENHSRYQNIFVQPVSGNAGTAVGAALETWHRVFRRTARVPFSTLALGPAYPAADIKQVLENCKLRFRYMVTTDEVIETAVAQLNDSKIVAWMHGRMEFGARALGNRSILASPGNPYSTENLNLFIKHREPFRKFAASVPAELAAEYFEVGANARYLATVGRVKPDYRSRFAAAVLTGDLVRVHTVDRDENPLYWKLLHAAGKATGLPVLYNTSFNLFGEPLVCSPRDAVRSFYSSGIDAMFVGNFFLQK
ncbi:MAG TPA: carbamoyltransferase C-terminal domain-containing protein [Candidatus Acidoferrales bacterium]|nr:carbamoyltransferase C-terminal domain-containing protein [Candidatus Acidoferrales bacterium]